MGFVCFGFLLSLFYFVRVFVCFCCFVYFGVFFCRVFLFYFVL